MPNLFVDLRGKAERLFTKVRDAPAQGQKFSSGAISLKTVLGPFQTANNVSYLTAKRGVAYFIHSVSFTAANTAADAGTIAYLSGTQGGVTCYLSAIRLVPSAANASVVCSVCDVLLDENTAVALTATNIGTTTYAINYSEVITEDI